MGAAVNQAWLLPGTGSHLPRWRHTRLNVEAGLVGREAWAGPIEAASTHLRKHDIEVEQGPVSRNGAKGRGTSVYFRDPDGRLLEFISYVA